METVRLYFLIDNAPFVKIVTETGITYMRLFHENGNFTEKPLTDKDRLIFMNGTAERMWIDETLAKDIASKKDYFTSD